MIPAENLISVATGTPTKIAVKVRVASCPPYAVVIVPPARTASLGRGALTSQWENQTSASMRVPSESKVAPSCESRNNGIYMALKYLPTLLKYQYSEYAN